MSMNADQGRKRCIYAVLRDVHQHLQVQAAVGVRARGGCDSCCAWHNSLDPDACSAQFGTVIPCTFQKPRLQQGTVRANENFGLSLQSQNNYHNLHLRYRLHLTKGLCLPVLTSEKKCESASGMDESCCSFNVLALKVNALAVLMPFACSTEPVALGSCLN